MKQSSCVLLLVILICTLSVSSLVAGSSTQEESFRVSADPGKAGGKLAITQRSEPRTFNPVPANDQASMGIIDRLNADLIHINRATQRTEPSLAKSWTVSKDGTQFVVKLRKGIKFSDGVPFDADDVVFSYSAYLDEKVPSLHRDLLLVDDKPMKVEKIDAYTVRFIFPGPYAPAERLFDSLAILPRHLLEQDYKDGKLGQMWGLNTPLDKIAGLGPFRLKQVVPGERIVLERNPYYWKVDAKGQKLPYLDELTFLIVPNQDAQVVRFQAGDAQIVSGLSGDNYAALESEQASHHFKLYDAGPGLEYNYLMFNLNDDVDAKLPELARKQKWFNDVRFRQAVSAAIDRAGIVRLALRGRGVALITHVPPGNKLWFNSNVQVPARSLPKARELLQAAGFSQKQNGNLVDSSGQPVEFTILVSSSNVQRSQMATLVQDDLKQLGMNVHVVTMESRATNDRVLRTHDYEAVIMGLVSGDADPTPDMNVLMSKGQSHFWHMGEKTPATPWEAEIDRIMQKQQVTLNHQQRKKLYDRIQEIEAEQLPMIYLASPNILVGAHEDLGNFHPAVIEQYTFWNAEELFWRTPAGSH